MPANIEPGTLIHGTLRNEDLLPAFADELERITFRGVGEVEIRIAEARELVPNGLLVEGNEEVETEVIFALMDLLNDYAPDGLYFGAHEGDGSDFGFWAIEDED